METVTPHSRTPEMTLRYVQAARKLRARLSKHPARLHSELRHLPTRLNSEPSEQQSDAKRSGVLADQLANPQVDRVRTFADCVRSSMNGPILRYSARIELFKVAHRRGIDRFQANLIVAAVLHEMRSAPVASRKTKPQPAGYRWSPLLAVAMVQSVIVAGACWIIWG